MQQSTRSRQEGRGAKLYSLRGTQRGVRWAFKVVDLVRNGSERSPFSFPEFIPTASKTQDPAKWTLGANHTALLHGIRFRLIGAFALGSFLRARDEIA